MLCGPKQPALTPKMPALRSRRVVLPDGTRPATLIIENGVIHQIAPHQDAPTNVQDWDNCAISPGLIDVHVHLNEPGRADWEGFETGTRAAIAGGITTLAEMPLNANPVTTSASAFDLKLAAARSHEGQTLRCDCAFWGGLIHGNADKCAALLHAGVWGLKAFLVDSGMADFSAARPADLRAVMPMLAAQGLPFLVHCELETEAGVDPPARLKNPRSYAAYLNSRPDEWEEYAIAGMIALCRETRCRTHIVHLSSAQALPMLREAKAEGLPLTVETCPHYLLFGAEEIEDGDTFFKCAPPIRAAQNRELLWEALREGTIDFIASDHSPCPPMMKRYTEGDFARAWGGISGLQWTLPALWSGAYERGFELEDVARWTAERPARLLGVEKTKGALAVGMSADVCVWEPETEFEVTPENTFTRHKASPYTGRRLRGRVRASYLRGERVYADGEFGAALGRVLLRPT